MAFSGGEIEKRDSNEGEAGEERVLDEDSYQQESISLRMAYEIIAGERLFRS